MNPKITENIIHVVKAVLVGLVVKILLSKKRK